MDGDVTVFIVDDEPAARDSVAALVGEKGYDWRTFDSAEQFLASYNGQDAGCLVTDLRMLGMNGVELQEALKSRGWQIPVIVITAYARTPSTVRAMQEGAITLLEKPCSPEDLTRAVATALHTDERRRTTATKCRRTRERLETLTTGEREVMEYIAAGTANKVTARRLDLGLRTVEKRRSEIFRKMGVRSVAELVRNLVEIELLDRAPPADPPQPPNDDQ